MRLRLLRFTALFCRRLRPCSTSLTQSSLTSVRAKRKRRLKLSSSDEDISTVLENKAFAAYDTLTPIPPVIIDRYRANVLTASGEMAGSNEWYGKPESPSLLDTLFSYIALSAAFTQLGNSQITRPWMLLTAQFMLGATLEQFLVYGATGREVIAEAFAYGCSSKLSEDDATKIDDDELIINNMFWYGHGDGAGNSEVGGWREIRSAHINSVSDPVAGCIRLTDYSDKLVPSEGTTLLEHLKDIEANELPISTLQPAIIDFLKHLLQAQPRPLLSQVEQGNVDGLTLEQSQSFLHKILLK